MLDCNETSNWHMLHDCMGGSRQWSDRLNCTFRMRNLFIIPEKILCLKKSLLPLHIAYWTMIIFRQAVDSYFRFEQTWARRSQNRSRFFFCCLGVLFSFGRIAIWLATLIIVSLASSLTISGLKFLVNKKIKSFKIFFLNFLPFLYTCPWRCLLFSRCFLSDSMWRWMNSLDLLCRSLNWMRIKLLSKFFSFIIKSQSSEHKLA